MEYMLFFCFRLAYKVLYSSLIQENFSNELNKETFSMLYASMCQLLGDVVNNGEGTENLLRKCLKRCMTSEITINKVDFCSVSQKQMLSFILLLNLIKHFFLL